MRKGVQELFIYSIEFYDDDSQKPEVRNGIVAAKSFTDAMLKLEQYYGKECIIAIHKMYELEEINELGDLLSEIDRL